MMRFEELLAHARDTYHAGFVQRVAQLRRSGESFAAEVLVQPNNWTSPPPFNLTRVDVLKGAEGDWGIERLVDAPADPVPAREYTTVDGLHVVAGVLGWESFTIAVVAPRFGFAELSKWLGRWLEVDDAHAEDATGLSGVVHGLAWERDGDRLLLTVDFGSAPPEAAHELLGVLAANGVTRCEILPPSPPES